MTPENTMEFQPAFGLASLLGMSGDLAGPVASALEEFEPRARFVTKDTLDLVLERVHDISVSVQET
jgi:hypothetical protein